MFAILPLLGGLLLGRFVNNVRIAAAVQAAFYAIAAAVLIGTAPRHDASHMQGAVFAMILLPVSIATLYLGTLWQHRTVVARQH